MQISTSLRLAAAAALLLAYAPLTAQNVGVDVATPVEKLDVLGAIRLGTTSNTNAGTIRWNSPNFQGYDGTQWVNFGGGTLTGSGTATRVAFWSGTSALSSSANLYWDNTNSRLGVGLTTPLGVLSAGSTMGNKVLAYDDGTDAAGLGIQAGALQMFTSNNTSNIVFGYGSSGSFTENMRIMGTGNVGIGTTTPASKLQVFRSSPANNTNVFGFGDGAGKGYLTAGGSYIAISTNDGVARIGISNSGATNGSVGIGLTTPVNKLDVEGGMAVGATYSGTSTAPTNGAIIEGNVGIGTTSPAQVLDVNGKIQMRTGAATGYVPVSDANGVMTWTNPTSLTITETDPQVSSTTTNNIPKWNGTALVDGVGYDNGTNVGIGTTSPDYKLHVSGSDYLTLKVAAPTNPLLKLSGSYNSGNGAEFWQDGAGDARINISGTTNAIYMKATGDIGLGISFPSVPAARLDVNNGTSTVPIFLARDNGTEVMRIADGGNVGIGTTAPGAKLEVAGQVKITGGTPALNQVLTSDGAGLATWEPIPVGTVLQDADADTKIQVEESADEDKIRFDTFGSERMIIDNTGNVGIGTTTPGAYLDITGTNGGTTSLQLRSGNTGVGTSSNQITFGYSGTETYRHAIKTRHNSGGAANNAIDFYVWKSGTDAAGTVGTQQVMTLDGGNGGSVGIGTTSPGARLEVLTNGTAGTGALISQFGSTAAAGRIRFYDEGATLGPKIDFNAGNVGQITGSGSIALMPGGNVGIGITTPGYKLDVNGTTQASTYYVNHGSGNVLEIGDDAWIADVNLGNMIGINGQSTASHGGIRLGSTAYVYSNGSANVGIGSTSPGHPLDVAGTIRASNEVRSGSGVFRSEQRGNFYLALQSDRNMVLYDGAAIWSSGTAVSDIRTKKDIRSLEEVLPTLMSLSAIRFKYKEELNMGDEEHVGVIAQEILKAYPDMVFHDEKSDRYLVYYDKLTTVLLKGIQELQTQVSELKNENTLLKSESNTKINSMQAQINMITEHLNMKTEK